ncbi:30S ribosomal protein S21, partial [Candidatus Woesearchaeota archaeon]|nr:30S ribosomal protein S21 [Candidatus Woesearchaeota archaeon]
KKTPGETTDSLIRKFTKKVFNEGILAELKKREFYQKPSLKRKLEREEARRSKGKFR